MSRGFQTGMYGGASIVPLLVLVALACPALLVLALGIGVLFVGVCALAACITPRKR